MFLTSVALGVIVICTGAVWARRSLVVVSVQGTSMEPAVVDGDRVLVRRRRLRRVKVGDIVVLEPPPDGPYRSAAEAGPDGRVWNVKRVAALPGDPLPPGVPAEPGTGTKPGRHTEPGTYAELGKHTEPGTDAEPGKQTESGGGRVGPGTFAVLGDNLADSIDSRHRGPYPAEQLMGVVVRRLSTR
ncbi:MULTISPECIES: signal peptidase I [Streptomyces]|uniref:signal peptidase I n=1 Tax=Streptomyces TaxID=1883 RepID=UPI001484EEB6|nr:signal peptidase I [Streptomyces sp. BPSDS2]